MKKLALTILAIISMSTATLAIWSKVSAAAGDLIIKQGAVASTGTATYAPSTTGPVTFSNTGSCPRWSGTITSTNLSSSPINSSISASNLEADDTVTFAVTVQNTSNSDNAFDIILHHDIPAGFELPATGAEGANVCVHNGAGSPIAYTSLGGGFFGPDGSDGIELVDSPSGALSATHPSNGLDIAVITFDLKVAANYVPGSNKTTTAELVGFSDSEGGDPFAGGTNSSSVRTRAFSQNKALQSTNQSFTTGNFVAIGEQLTYSVTVSIPQGDSSNVRMSDVMPSGLAFVGCNSITNNDPGDVTTDLAGGLASACNDPTNPVITNNGKTATFTLGNIVNADRTKADNETITIVYAAIVNNVAQATNSASLDNAASVQWTGGNSASESASVTVHEPILITTTNVSPSTGLNIGSQVHVTATVAHAPTSTSPAFNIAAKSVVPAGLQSIPASETCTNPSGAVVSCTLTSNQLHAEFDFLPMGQTATLNFDARITSATIGQGATVGTTASWSSMASISTAPQSAYSPTTTPRFASLSGDGSNSYVSSSNASISLAGSDSLPNSSGGRLPDTGISWWLILGASGLVIIITGIVVCRRICK